MSDEGDEIAVDSDLRGDGGDGGREQLSRMLEILSDRHRRHALYYLREHEISDIDGLARYLAAERLESSTETVADDQIEKTKTRVIHSDLPKLREAGVVEYDSRTETVRYQRPSRILQLLLRVCSEFEEPSVRTD